MARSLVLVLLGSALAAGLAMAQTPPEPPPPTVSTVTISAPVGTSAAPFRTSNEVVGIDFTSDAVNGSFYAVSVGADVPMGIFLFNGGGGRVGAGFNDVEKGVRSVQVTVTSAVTKLAVQVAATSAPTYVYFDKKPPTLVLQQIQVNEQEGFVPYEPGKVYYSNADQVLIKGRVDDGAFGTPPAEIEIFSRGTPTQATASADDAGQFEISVDIGGMSDGPIDLQVVARDVMSDGSKGNESTSEIPVGGQ